MKDKLTDKACRNLPPGKHFDGGGLYLHVFPAEKGGGRYWRQKYAKGKKTLSHGVYPDVTLKEAREKRDEAKKLIKAGIDPIARRREEQSAKEQAAAAALAAGAETIAAQTPFADYIEGYYEKNYRPWSSTHRRDVRRIIDSELVPALGQIPPRKISRKADLQPMFDRIEARGALTFARDVLTYFRAIWKYMNVSLDEPIPDPSKDIDLKEPPEERGHPALALQEVGAFLRTLEHSDATPIVRIAVRLLLLTAVRTKELREAPWGEFDTKAALWRVPAQRMKAKRDHLVPLSRQSLALLAALRAHTGDKKFLFPNSRDEDRPMSEGAILASLKRMGYRGRATGHGMRSTFSTWCHENEFSSDAIERQLAHAPADKVKAAYLRSEFLAARTKMMQAWADWLDETAATADVIPLRQAK